MSRLDELYTLREKVDAAIAREQAQMLRVARLRDTVRDTLQAHAPATVQTLQAVATAYDTTVVDLLSNRGRRGAAVRSVAAVVLREQGLSYPEIGKVIGRDHSTVMAACRRVAERPDLAEAADQVLAGLDLEPVARLPHQEEEVLAWTG